MNGFLGSSNHLDWTVFSLVVFTGLWLLGLDMAWRLKNMGIGRLALVASLVWIIGAGMIIVGFSLGD